MIIDISKVVKSINKEVSEEVSIELTSFESRLGEFPILQKSPVVLTIANQENKTLFIRGAVDVTLSIPCGRCLGEVPTQICFDIDKKLDINESILVDDEMEENERISEVKSSFDGKLIQLIGWKLLGLLLAIITLGIAYPATLCFIERWKCKHSIVSGKRLTFDGKGIQLFGKWCLWLLLCVVTFGVYAWFIPIRIEKWKTYHTHFEDEPLETRNSNFDGNLLQLIGLNLLSIFVVVITFGLAYPSVLCWKEKLK